MMDLMMAMTPSQQIQLNGWIQMMMVLEIMPIQMMMETEFQTIGTTLLTPFMKSSFQSYVFKSALLWHNQITMDISKYRKDFPILNTEDGPTYLDSACMTLRPQAPWALHNL